MIDRLNRDLGASALRDLIDGRITNDEFMRKFPGSSDLALPAIRHVAWGQFSDLREHKLVGRDSPAPDKRALLERCHLFLESELEFEWPLPIPGIGLVLLRIVTLGLGGRAADEEYMSKGDFEVWPFIRKNDYEVLIPTET